MGKIFFKDSDGVELCGILSNPSDDVSRPIMILCHGFTASKNSSTYLRLEEILNKANIATFRFDFFGHGESQGDFSEITVSKAVDSILRAIEYIKFLGYAKIGLFGSSFGGISSIVAASKAADLSLLVLKSPVSDYLEVETRRKSKTDIKNWRDKGYIIDIDSKGEKRKLNYTFFEDIKNLDGYEYAKNINLPTLIVHGNKDSTVLIEQSRKTAGIIKNCTLEVINGADHNYTHPGEFDKMINIASKFIISNI
ncbi:MAG: alpha/beta fold hydrolase [Patescibacteria group bacterium]